MSTLHYTATVRPDRSLQLPTEAHGLLTPGQEIEIDLSSTAKALAKPNERALETLRILAEMKKDMRETDGSQTDLMIRECRSGADTTMLLPSSAGALIVDANVLIAVASKEAIRDAQASAELAQYAAHGYTWYAPGLVISEVLYVLCSKLASGALTLIEYEKAVKQFDVTMRDVFPPNPSEMRPWYYEQPTYVEVMAADDPLTAYISHLRNRCPASVRRFS